MVGAWLRQNNGMAEIPEVDWQGTPPKVQQLFQRESDQLHKDPRSADAWGRMASFLMAHQQSEPARVCFERASRLGRQDFRWPYCLAVMREAVDWGESAELYKEAVSLSPKYIPARLRLAAMYMRLGDTDLAAAEYQEVLASADLAHFGHLGLARIALSEGRHPEAREHLEQAVAAAPWNRGAHAELARVYQILGQTTQAIREQLQVARLPPAETRIPDPVLQQVEKYEAVSRQLARRADELAMTGDARMSSEALEQMVRERPELVRPRINLTQMLIAQGRVPDALEVISRAMRDFPKSAEVYYSLGMACEAARRPADAISAYKRSLECKPDYVDALFALGLLQEQQGKLADAVASYRGAAEASPDFAPAHLSLGMALHRLGRTDESIPHIRHAVQLTPGDPVPQQAMDQVLKEKNR